MISKINYSISTPQSASLNGSQSEVGTQVVSLDDTFGASVTNQLVSVSFTTASMQGLFLLSDKGLTIKTNSSGSPAQTIVLKPGIPLVWGLSAGYFANPITTNVTAFYVTTTSASRLQMQLLKT